MEPGEKLTGLHLLDWREHEGVLVRLDTMLPPSPHGVRWSASYRLRIDAVEDTLMGRLARRGYHEVQLLDGSYVDEKEISDGTGRTREICLLRLREGVKPEVVFRYPRFLSHGHDAGIGFDTAAKARKIVVFGAEHAGKHDHPRYWKASIWVVDLERHRTTLIAAGIQETQTGDPQVEACLSPDGHRIAYTSPTNPQRVIVETLH